MPMKHYVLKYDRGIGRILRLEEFKTIEGAFIRHQALIDEFANQPEISISLLSAKDRVSVIKNFGSFFHRCPHHDKHCVKLNYKCKEDPPGSGDFTCPDTKEDGRDGHEGRQVSMETLLSTSKSRKEYETTRKISPDAERLVGRNEIKYLSPHIGRRVEERLADVDAVFARVNVPFYRGVIAASGDEPFAAANMVGGILKINDRYIQEEMIKRYPLMDSKSLTSKIHTDTKKLSYMIKELKKQKDWEDEFGPPILISRDGKTRMDKMQDSINLLKKEIRHDISMKEIVDAGGKPDPLSKWTFGDPPEEKPEHTEAFIGGSDTVHSIIDHESAHQISEYWKSEEAATALKDVLGHDIRTPIRRKVVQLALGDVPIGNASDDVKANTMKIEKFLKDNSPSGYGETNPEEFWAESYVCWKNGRKDLVHPGMQEIFKEVGL